MAAPLLFQLLEPPLRPYVDARALAFVLGAGGSRASTLCGVAACWAAFYLGIIIFYNTIVPLVVKYCARRWPRAPTSQVAPELVQNMKQVAYTAFPLYVTVPMLTDVFHVSGWSRTCTSLEECGGWAGALAGCVLYFAFLEIVIFIDHYYLLHKLELGKRLGQHAQHHVYKFADQLNAFSAYSFAPQDGWSQGLALALGTLVVRVPLPFVYTMEVLTGLWTIYIHTDVCPLPWPFMGCDYHYIHHRYNWYNFGFMTVTMDTLFRTVKHPKGKALALSRGELPMPAEEKKRSDALTDAILSSRGVMSANELMRGEDQQEEREGGARRRQTAGQPAGAD